MVKALEAATNLDQLWQLAPIYLLAINGITYLAFRDDKRRAREGQFRISEKTLLSMAVLGGSPAALFAQRRLRHKTKKQPFGAILLCIVGIQFGAFLDFALSYTPLAFNLEFPVSKKTGRP